MESALRREDKLDLFGHMTWQFMEITFLTNWHWPVLDAKDFVQHAFVGQLRTHWGDSVYRPINNDDLIDRPWICMGSICMTSCFRKLCIGRSLLAKWGMGHIHGLFLIIMAIKTLPPIMTCIMQEKKRNGRTGVLSSPKIVLCPSLSADTISSPSLPLVMYPGFLAVPFVIQIKDIAHWLVMKPFFLVAPMPDKQLK